MPIAKPTGHPTPKPINLMGELILASTNEDGIVLDPFIGGVQPELLLLEQIESLLE